MDIPKSYVYFRLISGDDFDPAIITQKIDLKPTKIHRKNDLITGSNVRKKISDWNLHTKKSEDNILIDELVDELVLKLWNKIDIINELKREFNLSSILEIVLYFDCNDEVSTPAIGHNLKTIEFLYKTATETDVDIYRYNSSEN
jgi:hypothetical protein